VRFSTNAMAAPFPSCAMAHGRGDAPRRDRGFLRCAFDSPLLHRRRSLRRRGDVALLFRSRVMTTRSILLQIALACAWMTVAAASEQPAHDAVSLQSSIEATVQQPRPFGYFIGDILTQRVLLEAAGRELEPTLPRAERVGIWFERRPARIETERKRVV